MKAWVPFLISLILGLLVAASPLLIFILGINDSQSYGEAGWVYMFFTIPVGGVIILVGLIVSIVMAISRRRHTG